MASRIKKTAARDLDVQSVVWLRGGSVIAVEDKLAPALTLMAKFRLASSLGGYRRLYRALMHGHRINPAAFASSGALCAPGGAAQQGWGGAPEPPEGGGARAYAGIGCGPGDPPGSPPLRPRCQRGPR